MKLKFILQVTDFPFEQGARKQKQGYREADMTVCCVSVSTTQLREIDQMTGFSTMLDIEDNGDIASMRGNSSQEIENKNMPENRRRNKRH